MRQANAARWAVLSAALLFFLTIFGWLMTSRQTVFGVPTLPTLSPEGHTLQIRSNLAQDRPVQALYHVEALAVRTGWSPELHEQAADIWERLGDSDTALFHWAQAAQAEPSPRRLRAIAETSLARGQWANAADALENLLALTPDNTWANFHMGMLRVAYDPDAAEVHLRQAAVDPAYNEAARAVRITLLEETRQDTQTEIRRPMLVGLAMLDYELWAYAELAFEEANTLSLALDGQPLAQALAYKSLAMGKQGKDGTAAISQAVRLAPNDAKIRYLLGLHYRTQTDYMASKDALVQATALDPSNPALYAELGTSYRLIGEYDRAEQWLQAAVSASNNDARFQQVLVQFYAEESANLGTDGLTAIVQALEETPEDANLLAGQAWSLFTIGNEADGLRIIEQALETDPSNMLARFYKARMLLVTGTDDTLARQLLEDVAASDAEVRAEAQRLLDAL